MKRKVMVTNQTVDAHAKLKNNIIKDVDFYSAENDYTKVGRRALDIDGVKFVSVNSFIGGRKQENLVTLNALALDLDIRKDVDASFSSDDSEQVKEYMSKIAYKCNSLHIPYPTRVVGSGNGLHLYWDLGTLNEAVFPAEQHSRPALGYKFKSVGVSRDLIKVYKAILNLLIENFADLGADKACRDIARVLRKPGESTKNGSVTKSLLKKHDLDKTGLCAISQFQDLLPHSYDEYKEWLKATSEQQQLFFDLQIEGLIDFDLHGHEYNRFEIAEFITPAMRRRPATDKQKEVIAKNNVQKLSKKEINALTINDADIIIKSTINRNTNYVSKYLNKVFSKNLVVEGKRTMFTYYYGVGQQLLYPKMDTEELLEKTYQKWLEFGLQLSEEDAKKAIASGIEHTGKGIKKQTLVDFFEGEVIKKNYNKKKVTLTNKQLIEKAIKTGIVNNNQQSLREIADDLGVSRSYVQKVKKAFRLKTEEAFKRVQERNAKRPANSRLSLVQVVEAALDLPRELMGVITEGFATGIFMDFMFFTIGDAGDDVATT